MFINNNTVKQKTTETQEEPTPGIEVSNFLEQF